MSLVVVKHTWHFVAEVVPSVNKQAAILALLFTSELLIMSFSYFRQSLHHIKFTIIYPVVGCTSVFTPKMLSLPSSTFKCLYSNGTLFWYFWGHRENSIDKFFNVWERKQAGKKHFVLHVFKTTASREGADNATGKQLDNINVVRLTSCFFTQAVKIASWHLDNINLGWGTSCFFLHVQYDQLYLNVFDLLGMQCIVLLKLYRHVWRHACAIARLSVKGLDHDLIAIWL